jgi:serine/threonine protein kinase
LLGVVLYEMLEGLPPFYSEEKDELLDNIIKMTLQLPHHISDKAKDLLMKLLEKEPSKRLGHKRGAEEIKEHPWFESVNWNEVLRRKVKPYTPYLYKSKEELIHEISKSNYFNDFRK